MSHAVNIRNLAWWDHRRHVLVALDRALAPLVAAMAPGKTIFDFGAGECPYQAMIEAGGSRYLAGDLAGQMDVHVVPGLPLPLETASIDGILSSQVLEHVADLDWYLGECRRVLKPGTPLVLSTHGVWLYHPHPTDYRRWTRDGLVLELESRGFQIDEITGVVGPLAWSTQVRLLGWRHALLKLPLVGRVLAGLMAVVMNVRMALEDAITPASIREVNACVYVVVARNDDS